VTPAGTVIALTRFTATFQAPDFDFRRFPFDHQRFFIRAALALPETRFHLEPLTEASGIGAQLGVEEWVIYEDHVFTATTTQITGLPSSEFMLEFKAHRHLLYYVMRIFLPMLVILTVTWFRRLPEKLIPNCAGFSFAFEGRRDEEGERKDQQGGMRFDRNRLKIDHLRPKRSTRLDPFQ
jgi:hypothetical protein